MDTSDILQLEEVSVDVGGRPILHDVSLRIRAGETHVLFGPNRSDKSSLLMAIMGLSRYRVTKGRILFQGQDITHLPVDERARLRIGLMQQRPPSVRAFRWDNSPKFRHRGRTANELRSWPTSLAAPVCSREM